MKSSILLVCLPITIIASIVILKEFNKNKAIVENDDFIIIDEI